jgi:hypothetical protein
LAPTVKNSVPSSPAIANYVSPMTFEKNWFAAQQGRAA